MLKVRDRLYGELQLPDLAWQLALSCPVLLRLREIRMANIPFLTHPSFAHVDRYEHSLGVAHLAWRWSNRRGLCKDDALALTLAALYHDGATPAFGHLFEEYLRRFGFDHEESLVNLLQGTTELPGAETAQIFLGRGCNLGSALPRPKSISSSLTTLGIADLTAGKGILGPLIKGRIDFDNIDNVVRASSAMGLGSTRELVHPYDIIDALALDDGEITIDESKLAAISAWSELRRQLYEAILNNQYEFRAQTTLKWAIEECAAKHDNLNHRAAWVITDPELTFTYLRRVPFSRALVDRLRLGNPPELLFSTWVSDLSILTGEQSGRTIRGLSDALSDLTNCEVHVNYYLDKRNRRINLPVRGNLNLFVPEQPVATLDVQQATGTGGVVGAIYVTRTERAAVEGVQGPYKPLAKRVVSLDEINSALVRYLHQPVHSTSLQWIGGNSTRSSMFSLSAI
jgi:HD superfamily phosphohydrolase